MDIVVTMPDIITNESGKYSAKNPWETHIFKYEQKYDKTIFFRTLAIRKYVKWYITGTPPNKIDIDQYVGTINGTISVLEDQSRVVVNDWFPKEPPRIDGSNWQSQGRPRSPTYNFPFNVVLEYWKYDITTAPRAYLKYNNYIHRLVKKCIRELQSTSKSDPEYNAKYLKYIRALNIYLQEYHIRKYEKKIEVLPTSIKVIKNNDLDAKAFFIAYLKAGPAWFGDYAVEHSLYRRGKRYTKANVTEFAAL